MCRLRVDPADNGESTMFEISDFHDQYQTDIVDLTVRGRPFQLYVPKAIDRFINSEDIFRDFPLWSKVWQASLILADAVAAMPATGSVLELGAGMGLVGVVAAAFGHRITITEYNDDALAFIHANAHLNHVPNPDIVKLDWFRPELSGTYDLIIGSELVYREADYHPLRRLFQTLLKPDGRILLAAEMRKTIPGFIQALEDAFDIRVQRLSLRSEEQVKEVIIIHMHPR